MKNLKSKLFKQRLFRVHTAIGITFSLLMYISIFFGVFTILLPFIQTWEKPSRHIKQVEITKINYNPIIDEVFKDPDFPKNNILLNLPGYMGDPALVITHRFAKPIAFNPITKEKLKNENKDTSHLAKFINELHYGIPLKFVGLILFGLVATGVLVLLITGFILIILFKFKNKTKNQQALFSKIHVKIFTWLFLPLSLITISGAVMNISLISSTPMAKMLSKGEARSIEGIVGKVLFKQNKPIKKAKIKAKMLPLNDLLKIAEKVNPQLILKQVKLMNWNDKNAQVEITGYNPYKPFLNGGIFNKPAIILSAVNGKVVKNQKTLDKPWPVFIAEGLFFLHFLFGIDVFTRIIMAILMALCGLAIGFGVMLWLEKKAKKYNNKAPFYHWVGKLSLTCMIGIIPTTGILFFSQWILPFDLQDRVIWQKGLFYNTWLFTLFWSFFRINSYKASKEFFFVGGIFFILTPIFHEINSGYTAFKLIDKDMTNIFGVDLGLLLFGLCLVYISKKLPKNREKAKLFWAKNKKD